MFWRKRDLLQHRDIPNMLCDLLIMDTEGTNTKSVLKKYITFTFKVFPPIEIILSFFLCCIFYRFHIDFIA